MKTPTQLSNEELAELCIQNANNFGPSPDMWHPQYGWLIKDGETTEAGRNFFEDQNDKLTPKVSQ